MNVEQEDDLRLSNWWTSWWLLPSRKEFLQNNEDPHTTAELSELEIVKQINLQTGDVEGRGGQKWK